MNQDESTVEPVSRREFGRRVGVSHGAVDQAIARGVIPSSSILPDGRLDFQKALVAWAARDSRHDEPPRLAEIRARLLELELARAMGLLVPIADVRRANWQIFRAARDGFLNIPERLASVVAAERDPARVHALMRAEIAKALLGLSEWARSQVATKQELPPDDS
jgi:hypothetical protein